MKKSVKKTDKELWELINEKIVNRDYIFLNHAKIRQKERFISELDVLNILLRKPLTRTKRNKKKDSFIIGYEEWNYCFEGYDINEHKIRIIISFDITDMLIVTVIRLES